MRGASIGPARRPQRGFLKGGLGMIAADEVIPGDFPRVTKVREMATIQVQRSIRNESQSRPARSTPASSNGALPLLPLRESVKRLKR